MRYAVFDAVEGLEAGDYDDPVVSVLRRALFEEALILICEERDPLVDSSKMNR